MNQSKKVAALILTAVVGLILFIIIYITKNSYKSDFVTAKKYYWLFKDSVIKDLDANFNFSLVKERDIFNHFIYKEHYLITIWEFKDLGNVDISKTPIKLNVSIPDLYISYGRGCILDPHGNPETILHYNFKTNCKLI